MMTLNWPGGGTGSICSATNLFELRSVRARSRGLFTRSMLRERSACTMVSRSIASTAVRCCGSLE